MVKEIDIDHKKISIVDDEEDDSPPISETPYIYDWRKRGVGRPKVCPPIISAMRQLRKEGWTYISISRECGVSQMTVWRYCKDVKKNE